jgi:hypothetical protein
LNDGPLQSRRGAAFGDLNNDGLIDAVVYNVGRPPTLFINETQNRNHRVLLKLVGVKSNRDAIGARVSLQTSTMSQIAEVHAGGCYLSSNDQRIHFGLGSERTIEKLTIRWPSGNVEVLTKLLADSIDTIVEGRGVQSAVVLSGVKGAPKDHSTTPKHIH